MTNQNAFSPEVSEVADRAVHEAQIQNSTHVRIEHLFTALVGDDHEGGEALAALKVNAEAVRQAIRKVTGYDAQAGEGQVVAQPDFDDQTIGILSAADVADSETPTLAILRKVVHAPSRTLADTFAEIEVGKHQFMREIDRLDVKTDVNAPHTDTVAPGDLQGSKKITINADVERVWAVVNNPARFGAWNPAVGNLTGNSFSEGQELQPQKTDSSTALVKVNKLVDSELISFVVDDYTIAFTLAPANTGSELTCTVTGQRVVTKGIVRSAGPAGVVKLPVIRGFYTLQAAGYAEAVKDEADGSTSGAKSALLRTAKKLFR